ncbi:MAG: phosphoribosyltransferase [Anaerolineae bacterium]|nr:phosphoribosyltransferase [Anaerolineae bacterium]
MQSYDYAHRQGIEDISWEHFAQLSAELAQRLGDAGVEVIVGIAKTGLFPATAVACHLRCEFYPVRVTRRVNDLVTYDQPVWKVDVSPEVEGKTVAVIDEMADSGETLALVAGRVQTLGATKVITASLISHSWANPAPDVITLVSDAFVIFPWGRRVYEHGQWPYNPELVEALALQGISPTELEW